MSTIKLSDAQSCYFSVIKRFREERKRAGVTLGGMADRLTVTAKTMTRWETQETDAPARQFFNWAARLGFVVRVERPDTPEDVAALLERLRLAEDGVEPGPIEDVHGNLMATVQDIEAYQQLCGEAADMIDRLQGAGHV